MRVSRWSQAARHFLPSLIGFPCYFLSQPLFAIKLLAIRVRYFFLRDLKNPLVTPDKYIIERPEELVSYWSFFVEREALSQDWIQALLSESNPLVVDVGANAGLFTHWVWSLKPQGRFIVFEPLPKMAEKIAKWGEATGASIILHNKAVSNQNGTVAFYASADNDTSASIRPEEAKSFKLEVSVVSLDSVLPPDQILMIKIDVEGLECEVLAGAGRALQRARFLLVEAHNQKALERIQAQLPAEWRCKQTGASDYLFSRT